MRIGWMLTMAALAIGGTALASDSVAVPGSGTRFLTEVETSVGGRTVTLELTGTAVRTRLIVNVYSIASYVQHGAGVTSADELARADCAKRLHLTMERTVDGKDMAEAFRSAIRQNHPEPAFTDEVNMLSQYMRNMSIRKGEQIYLTHVPGIGLHCSVAGKADLTIRNVRFSQAVWEIYLGRQNVGETIKKGLTSRL